VQEGIDNCASALSIFLWKMVAAAAVLKTVPWHYWSSLAHETMAAASVWMKAPGHCWSFLTFVKERVA
jgi:hypothetical protein